MKIAILGPVYSEQYFGGVATFDENLAIAYKKLKQDNDVTLYSNMITSKSINAYGIAYSPINLMKAWQLKNYDLIIASLDYAHYLPLIKAKNKIYFLHGFFSLSAYSTLKTILSVCYQKFFSQYADYIISNSKFTSFINNKIYNIKSNGIAYLGVSYDYLSNLDEDIYKEKNTILFTGRLVKAKNVFQIIKAVEILTAKYGNKYMLRIVGDGNLKRELEEYVNRKKLSVKFYGRVSQSEIVKFYKKSDIFISLNAAEPFGITFCEALLAGCKIICPDTGGQIEFLRLYPHTVRMISNSNAYAIVKAVEELSTENEREQIECKEYRYEKTAQTILNIIGDNN